MDPVVLGGLIRHAMTAIGGVLTALGIANPAEWSPVIEAAVTIGGGALTLWGFVASVRDKYRR